MVVLIFFIPVNSQQKEPVITQTLKSNMQLNIPASKATDNQIHTENVKTNPAPEVSELNRYIMRKDLLITRLSQFDDKPER